MILDAANRRLLVLLRVLQPPNASKISQEIVLKRYCSSSPETQGEIVVTIGDVKKTVKAPKFPQYVPKKYLEEPLSQDTLHHLRWMLQKDKLGQDMFLIGRPGPRKAHLALQYLELTGRELEYVALSRDTTESDLKQRREIFRGTAAYIDQSAVRAAVEGRVLVLQGIEKAERNVLPVLNNLLENREMHLEDGRFLIPATRYDKLLQEHSKSELDKWGLVRVSEEFRVIALGLPVPGYYGNPLDPPLRSRFQARNVIPPTYHESLESLTAKYPSVPQEKLAKLLSCVYALLSPESAAIGLPDFPVDNLHVIVKLLENFPWLTVRDAFERIYPFNSFLPKEGKQAVEDILSSFNVTEESQNTKLESVTFGAGNTEATVSCTGTKRTIQVPCGQVNEFSVKELPGYIKTDFQEKSFIELLQTHSVSDICVVGARGCGKSTVVHRLAHKLGYTMEPIILYQDMTSRDLIQQRTTLPNGDTVWRHAPLVNAALEGKMAVLDGIHRLHPSTSTVLQRLVHDRELQLYDGRRLLSADRYDALISELGESKVIESGILRIHPSFRIVALAEPPVFWKCFSHPFS